VLEKVVVAIDKFIANWLKKTIAMPLKLLLDAFTTKF
jgi:hypothetical protein